MGGEGGTLDGSARDDELDDSPVVDELTGLANRRGFMEILRMEERRHARYGGSPILVMVDVAKAVARVPEAERDEILLQTAAIVADAMRDTDTVARVDDTRFGILAIQAGCSAFSIVGRLKLQFELRRIGQVDVAVGESGSLIAAWRALETPAAQPTLRLVR